MQTPMHLYRIGTGEHFLRQDDGAYVPVTSVAGEDVDGGDGSGGVPFTELAEGQPLELVDPNEVPIEPAHEVYEDWQPHEGRVRFDGIKVGGCVRITDQ
jgi:hypothetical protein